jgi:hypothetical protein
VHDVGDDGLTPFAAWTAAISTDLRYSGPVRHLAVWRLLPDVAAGNDPVWELVRRAAAPAPAYLYVPAFSMARATVQRIGVRLTEVQPVVELTSGAPAGPSIGLMAVPTPVLTSVPRPVLDGVPDHPPAAAPSPPSDTPGGEPDFQAVSPILIGRREAWGLAHFVYMAVQAREAHELPATDLRLQPDGEELLFLPAVWDPRYIHESNWRLLLREFDGLVA